MWDQVAVEFEEGKGRINVPGNQVATRVGDGWFSHLAVLAGDLAGVGG